MGSPAVRPGVRVPGLQDGGQNAITRTGKQPELEKEFFALKKKVDALATRFERRATSDGEIQDYLVISSPNGTKFRISVDDVGVVSATAVPV